jgi:hypothetical protein
MSLKERLIGSCLIALMLILPGSANAERFADLMVGFSYTQDSDLSFASGDTRVESDISFDGSFAIGYRLGYWFEGQPEFGLALEADSVTPLVMLRLPLSISQKYPKGEWAPFIAGGPGIFFSKMKYEVANSPVPDIIGMPTVTGEYKDDQIDIGLDLRAGVKKMMAPNWALSLEYRFFWFEPEYDDNVLGSSVQTGVDLYTHSLMIGVTFNY